MQITDQARSCFSEELWNYYAHHMRTGLPWRQPDANGRFDPYHVLVSELMLQQTQVQRVIPKYQAFLAEFPTVADLAGAQLGDVLRVWQGLGYNRRAKFLWQAAQCVHNDGDFPSSVQTLIALPGVGKNTAGAIMAYAYNQPVLYVETNIRTVYIHHFFRDETNVSDADILSALEQTLDHENPREFYWALMDYGSYLKASIGNVNTASKHYTKQSQFHGSKRQIRGQVLRLLGAADQSLADLQKVITDKRLEPVLADLLQEELVRLRHGTYSL